MNLESQLLFLMSMVLFCMAILLWIETSQTHYFRRLLALYRRLHNFDEEEIAILKHQLKKVKK